MSTTPVATVGSLIKKVLELVPPIALIGVVVLLFGSETDTSFIQVNSAKR